MSSTSSSSSTAFTGSSAFSADLQNAISRAVSFASLPIQLLQNKQNDAANQKTALQSLSSRFQSLQNAIDALNSSVSNNSYVAAVSTTSVGTAFTSSGVTAGSYSLNVTNIGSHTNTMSADHLTLVTIPSSGNISSASSFTLTVDGHSYAISNPSGSLNQLAAAINASAANVQATVVNVGGSNSPDYRLSIQAKNFGPTGIQLADDQGNSLLNTLSSGTNVTYRVNGQTTDATSDSRSITLAPGLTVNLLATGSTDIDVSQNVGGISNALTAFVSAYNAAVDELGKSRGQNSSALSGNSIVYTLQDNLRQLIASGVPSGPINSMSDLGLSFDQNGHLALDSAALSKVTSSSLTNVLSFLGSESTGGFLKSADAILTGISDGTTGVLQKAADSLTSQISSLNQQISDKQDRVTLLQQTLTAQMSKADATISSLQQQVSYYTTLFTTMRSNNSSNG